METQKESWGTGLSKGSTKKTKENRERQSQLIETRQDKRDIGKNGYKEIPWTIGRTLWSLDKLQWLGFRGNFAAPFTGLFHSDLGGKQG